MSKPIFSSYGVEIFKELLGYRLVFESAGHGGGLLSLHLGREDAERAMRGPDEAAEVLDRLGGKARPVRS